MSLVFLPIDTNKEDDRWIMVMRITPKSIIAGPESLNFPLVGSHRKPGVYYFVVPHVGVECLPHGELGLKIEAWHYSVVGRQEVAF